MSSTITTPDFEPIKKKQRAGWETGDYTRVGNTLQIIAERLVEAADVRAGQRVLDVACGQGNAALAAARRFAEATGVDYARNLLESGPRAGARPSTCRSRSSRATPRRCRCRTPRSTCTLSTVGVMFAPDHQRAADELVRVTAPGGRIALASWTPSGMIGQLFRRRHAGRRRRPACGRRPLWGTPEHLAELFGDRVEWVSTRTRIYIFRYHSPEHFSEWFRQFYGPITRLAGTLDGEDLRRFADDLADVAAPVQPRRRRHRWRAEPSTSRRSASGAHNRPITGEDSAGSAHGHDPAARTAGHRTRRPAGRPPRGRKAWALLAYLLLAERPPSRRHLAELLFADADDPLGALRWTLAELRRALGVPGLFAGDPVAAALGGDVVVDVRRCSPTRTPTPRRCWPPAASCSRASAARRCPEFESWLLVARHRVSAAVEARLRQAAVALLAARPRRPRRSPYASARRRPQPARRGQPRAARAQPRHGRRPGGGAAAGRGRARTCCAASSASSRRAALRDAADRPPARRWCCPSQRPGRGREPARGRAARRSWPARSTPASSACAGRSRRRPRCGDAALQGRALVALGGALVHAVRGRDEEGAVVLHEAIALRRPRRRPRDGGHRPPGAGLRRGAGRPAGHRRGVAGARPQALAETDERAGRDPRRPRDERLRPRRLPGRLRAPRRVRRRAPARAARPPAAGLVAVARRPGAPAARRAQPGGRRAGPLAGAGAASSAGWRSCPGRRRCGPSSTCTPATSTAPPTASSRPGRWPASSATRAGRAWPRAASACCTPAAGDHAAATTLARARPPLRSQPGRRTATSGCTRTCSTPRSRPRSTAASPSAPGRWSAALAALAARCDMRELVVRAHLHRHRLGDRGGARLGPPARRGDRQPGPGRAALAAGRDSGEGPAHGSWRRPIGLPSGSLRTATSVPPPTSLTGCTSLAPATTSSCTRAVMSWTFQ